MRIVTDPYELQRECAELRRAGRRVGFVPTMGFFHKGHLALMDEAGRRADTVVVSLFVNPTQFGPNEDLAAYPRDFDQDCRLAAKHGVDVMFAPAPEAMYLPGEETRIEVPAIASGLCGASRPVHFRGVATVVAKLFNLVQPDVAVFGQKDWQQLAVIRRMAADLFFPVEIVGHPIVREADGLALSSRNVYLTPEERSQAAGLQAGLRAARERLRAGERSAAALKEFIRDFYTARVPLGRVDYVEIVHPETLTCLTEIDAAALAAVAVFMGRARLIDNLLLTA